MNDRPDIADTGGLLKIQQTIHERKHSSYRLTTLGVRVPGIMSADRDVVSSDNVDQESDVSIREVLSGHLLPLLPVRLQGPLGLGQFEQVPAQHPAKASAECQCGDIP